MSSHEHEEKEAIPRGTFLLLFVFLILVAAAWANVFLRVVGRA